MKPQELGTTRLDDLKEVQPCSLGETRDWADRLERLEAENGRLASRCRELERRYLALLGLYVAARRLHSTLQRDAFLSALEEVLASLVGCEHAALYELDNGLLRPTALFGMAVDEAPTVALSEGVIGRSAASGQVYVATEGQPPSDGVSACVPLLLEGRTVGAIVLFRLLGQKPSLGEADHEMLQLLSAHAAVALHATSPRSDARPR
jgi:GAF domain-containing protein